MFKVTFGTPEQHVPSAYCPSFNYTPSAANYPVESIVYEQTDRGVLIKMPMGENEHIYGLGLQLKAFDLRGRKWVMRPNADPVAATGDSHAPVPFFASTAGYAVYVDTARYAEFYFGSSRPLKRREVEAVSTIKASTDELYATTVQSDSQIVIYIPFAKGVDLYLFEGDTITDMVAQYNRLAGGGCTVPEWGLSTIYRCYTGYHQDTVLQKAKQFREDGMDVGIIGLEPGWQTHSYSCSYVWSDRYPDPKGLLKDLREMDYHVNLWEHAYVHPTAPIYDELIALSGDYEVWQGLVPDFTLPEARTKFAAHHKTIVDIGVDGFKLDECDGSDYTGSWMFPIFTKFPSGIDGDQYRSLFGTTYMQAVLQALGDHPTLSEVRNAGALAAPYPFVLYSDLYDHKDFIRGCATAGFSGLLWTPELRDAQSKDEFLRRLQATVFSVQSLINAWYCEEEPWVAHDCKEEVKYWLSVRRGLIPLLKDAFDRYHNTGIAPCRAVVSDYSHDPETYQIDDEYLLGDRLLVAPLAVGEEERRVYLPAGNWRDYFTKEPVQNGWFTIKTDGIPVYETY